MDSILLLSAFSVLSVGLVLGTLSYFYMERVKTQAWRARLQSLSKDNSPFMVQENSFSRLSTFFFHILEQLGKVSTPEDEKSLTHLRAQLMGAGYRNFRGPVYIWGAKLLLLVLVPLICLLMPETPFIANLSLFHQFTLLFCFSALGFYLPNLWLYNKVQNRQQKFVEGFPDALDLLVVCVEAGLALDSAIRRVGDEIALAHPVMSEELQYLSLQLRTGLTREMALRQLSQRMNVEEVRSLTSLIIQTDRFGTSIARALRVHSDSMRKKRFHRAEEKAAKLPAKMVLPLMFFIFPVLFLIILGPAGLQVAKYLYPE
ncbi:MAG: type II secretion system F family protein [Nitrospirae bacterium]|nr:type II secretion system F family protein [Nitrospirota bacterium]